MDLELLNRDLPYIFVPNIVARLTWLGLYNLRQASRSMREAVGKALIQYDKIADLDPNNFFAGLERDEPSHDEKRAAARIYIGHARRCGITDVTIIKAICSADSVAAAEMIRPANRRARYAINELLCSIYCGQNVLAYLEKHYPDLEGHPNRLEYWRELRDKELYSPTSHPHHRAVRIINSIRRSDPFIVVNTFAWSNLLDLIMAEYLNTSGVDHLSMPMPIIIYALREVNFSVNLGFLLFHSPAVVKKVYIYLYYHKPQQLFSVDLNYIVEALKAEPTFDEHNTILSIVNYILDNKPDRQVRNDEILHMLTFLKLLSGDILVKIASMAEDIITLLRINSRGDYGRRLLAFALAFFKWQKGEFAGNAYGLVSFLQSDSTWPLIEPSLYNMDPVNYRRFMDGLSQNWEHEIEFWILDIILENEPQPPSVNDDTDPYLLCAECVSFAQFKAIAENVYYGIVYDIFHTPHPEQHIDTIYIINYLADEDWLKRVIRPFSNRGLSSFLDFWKQYYGEALAILVAISDTEDKMIKKQALLTMDKLGHIYRKLIAHRAVDMGKIGRARVISQARASCRELNMLY